VSSLWEAGAAPTGRSGGTTDWTVPIRATPHGSERDHGHRGALARSTHPGTTQARVWAQNQRDITSASSVWAVAVLGIFTGLGRIFLPVALTLLILFVLEIEHIPVLRRLDLGLRRAVKEQTAEPAVNRGRDEGD
jgi:hypothetical protein